MTNYLCPICQYWGHAPAQNCRSKPCENYTDEGWPWDDKGRELEGKTMTKNRFEYQTIVGRTETNYRITDNKTDSRIATCYDEGNARFVVALLNLGWETQRAKAK